MTAYRYLATTIVTFPFGRILRIDIICIDNSYSELRIANIVAVVCHAIQSDWSGNHGRLIAAIEV